jgi:hypothetical protein
MELYVQGIGYRPLLSPSKHTPGREALHPMNHHLQQEGRAQGGETGGLSGDLPAEGYQLEDPFC